MVVSGVVHAQADLVPGERAPRTHWIGGWVGRKAGLGAVEKRKKKYLARAANRTPGRPARRLWLYRLQNLGTNDTCCCQAVTHPSTSAPCLQSPSFYVFCLK
jgi:hypothetical protein